MSAVTSKPTGSRLGWFIVGGLLVALVLAGVVSNYASSHPDGLDSATLEGCTVDGEGNITGGTCPAQSAEEHELADGPLAEYGIRGVDNQLLSTGLSGVLGVLLTFGIGAVLFRVVRRRGPGSVQGRGGSGAGASGAGASGAGAEETAPAATHEKRP